MQDFIYGMACFETKKLSEKSSFLDDMYLELTNQQLPGNNSEIVREELLQVKEFSENLVKNDETLKRYQTYDRSISQYLSGFTLQGDDNFSIRNRDIVKNVTQDIWPLIYKLKLHYQRPRPFQLSMLHSIKIYPMASLTAQCPSFPSMHSTLGYVIAGVCGNKFPDLYKYYKDLAEDIRHSRVWMGLCLPSDVNAGQLLANHILENKEFIVKYGL